MPYKRILVLFTLVVTTCMLIFYHKDMISMEILPIGRRGLTEVVTIISPTSQTSAPQDKKAGFQAAKAEVKKLLSLIYHRYELNTKQGSQFMLTSNNINTKTWDIIKWTVAARMLKGGGGNVTYLMTFGGSSVTAAHDNMYNESYPAIFKKRMNSVFSALGIELIVHNIALGANQCVPYILCYEAMGGENPDFIGWEQSYNCGRDEAVFESAIRFAAWNSPSVVYFSASGAFSPTSCPPANYSGLPYSSEVWSPSSLAWNGSLDEIEEQKKLLLKFNEKNPSSARFAGRYPDDYRGVGTFGFNVWEKNEHCRYTNPKSHREETCSGYDAVEGCGLKFLTKEASVYGSEKGNGAAWHPPRAFHMLRGEFIAWLYSLIIYETILMVEQDLLTKDANILLTEYEGQVKKYREGSVTSKYKKCGQYRCEKKPICYTDFKPHYPTKFHLQELIVGSTGWMYQPCDYSAWSYRYGYLDAKPFYSANGKNTSCGEIHVKVTIETTNYLWFCGMNKESLAHAVFKIQANVKNEQLVNYLPAANRPLWTNKRYVGSECKELYSLPKGQHVISISNGGNKTIELTHIILWP